MTQHEIESRVPPYTARTSTRTNSARLLSSYEYLVGDTSPSTSTSNRSRGEQKPGLTLASPEPGHCTVPYQSTVPYRTAAICGEIGNWSSWAEGLSN
eukprot:scaffold237737_cov18-Prasinocladus_malaysianus.AAC.1